MTKINFEKTYVQTCTYFFNKLSNKIDAIQQIVLDYYLKNFNKTLFWK